MNMYSSMVSNRSSVESSTRITRFGTELAVLAISTILATFPECFPPTTMATLPSSKGKWSTIRNRSSPSIPRVTTMESFAL